MAFRTSYATRVDITLPLKKTSPAVEVGDARRDVGDDDDSDGTMDSPSKLLPFSLNPHRRQQQHRPSCISRARAFTHHSSTSSSPPSSSIVVVVSLYISFVLASCSAAVTLDDNDVGASLGSATSSSRRHGYGNHVIKRSARAQTMNGSFNSHPEVGAAASTVFVCLRSVSFSD